MQRWTQSTTSVSTRDPKFTSHRIENSSHVHFRPQNKSVTNGFPLSAMRSLSRPFCRHMRLMVALVRVRMRPARFACVHTWRSFHSVRVFIAYCVLYMYNIRYMYFVSLVCGSAVSSL